MKNILYCAIRKKELVRQTICSMKSIMNFYSSGIRFIIVTDQYLEFTQEIKKVPLSKEFEICFHIIGDDTVNSWIGKDDYIFRVKIKTMKYYFDHYDENVIFLDSDTYLMKNIDFLFELIKNNYCVMGKLKTMYQNVKEFLEKENPIGMKKFDIKNDILHINYKNDHYNINLDTKYFSSIVIGMNKNHSDCLDMVERVNDYIYGIHKIHVTEELCFSLVFGLKYKIFSSMDYVMEYSHNFIGQLLLYNYFTYLTDDELYTLNKSLSYFNLTQEQINKMNYREIQWLIFILTAFILLKDFDCDINSILLIGRINRIIEKSEKNEFIAFFEKYLNMTHLSLREQYKILQRDDVKEFIKANDDLKRTI